MNHNTQMLKEKYYSIVKSMSCEPDAADYDSLDKKIQTIRQLSQMENRATALYDINRKRFVYKNDSNLALLGFSEDEYDVNDVAAYHDMIHSDDLAFMYDSEIQMFHFLRSREPAERKNCKLVYDYRVRNKQGKYIRFVHQLKIFETDRLGNSWILLVLSDVLSKYEDFNRSRRAIIDIRDNSVCFFNEEMDGRTEMLSKRELEVLGLIAQGLDSEEVAGRLFISVNTVNNHRQRILEKTMCNNVSQAIRYLKCIGILG